MIPLETKIQEFSSERRLGQTYSGKASIRRFGSSWPNEARMPTSNRTGDLEISGSMFGQVCVVSWSFFAPSITVFDVETVVTTSRCPIRGCALASSRYR